MILHSIEQAAERVHRDPETIRRWIRQGRLAARLEPISGLRFVEDEALMLAEQGARRARKATWFAANQQPERRAS